MQELSVTWGCKVACPRGSVAGCRNRQEQGEDEGNKICRYVPEIPDCIVNQGPAVAPGRFGLCNLSAGLLPAVEGFIWKVVSGRQTEGKGRSGVSCF